MSDSIDTGSPLGEDFYSFEKEDEVTDSEINSQPKVSDKKNTNKKDKDIDTEGTVKYFKSTNTEPDL